MDLEPKNKMMIDALMYAQNGARTQRNRVRWFLVAVLSAATAAISMIEALPGWLRMTLFVASCLGGLAFLTFLSTTPMGKRIADAWRD